MTGPYRREAEVIRGRCGARVAPGAGVSRASASSCRVPSAARIPLRGVGRCAWPHRPRRARANVEREFRRYLECGILAHGFTRWRRGRCSINGGLPDYSAATTNGRGWPISAAHGKRRSVAGPPYSSSAPVARSNRSHFERFGESFRCRWQTNSSNFLPARTIDSSVSQLQ